MDISSRTPADLVITPRNFRIARDLLRARWWKSGDPVATAYYNSLSAVFPAGEAFFIDSVRHYRDSLPPTLQQQVDAFIKQEAAHSREHGRLNRQIREAGYDLSKIEAGDAAFHESVKGQPPDVNLAITVATEHLTAIFANAALRDDRLFKDDPPDIARIWKWHSIEEIEHKAVAYDTFLVATRELSGLQRWTLRCLIMLVVTRDFVIERFRYMGYFFEQDGIRTSKTWFRAVWFLFGYPGVFRTIIPAWLGFFRPGFHPWQHDDRKLIAKAEAELTAGSAGQSEA